MSDPTRPLTEEERTLLRWMLENGGDEARAFLPQLDLADATTWKCPCGCASFDLKIRGCSKPTNCYRIFASFDVVGADTPSGVNIMESGGFLRHVQVWGEVENAPKTLPNQEELRPSP